MFTFHLIEAYNLDFSYGHTPNCEARLFINIPMSLRENTQLLEVVSIMFEMHSAYKNSDNKLNLHFKHNELWSSKMPNYRTTNGLESNESDFSYIAKITSPEEIYPLLDEQLPLILEKYKESFPEFVRNVYGKRGVTSSEEMDKILQIELPRFSYFLQAVEEQIKSWKENTPSDINSMSKHNLTIEEHLLEDRDTLETFKLWSSFNLHKNLNETLAQPKNNTQRAKI